MNRTYSHRRFRVATLLSALLGLLASSGAHGASLAAPTVQEWEEHIKVRTAEMEQRLQAGHSYLWVDEAPERLAKIRAGEIVISPVGKHNPKRVPAGLIHDWIGAIFIADATIDDVLQVLRDYARYRDLFQPAVVDSKLIAAADNRDFFSLVLMNKSIVAKFALDADYESTYVRLDDHRAYTISRTTRVQEIEEYGSPSQYKLNEGAGRGILWRLFSIARYMERDGGVYIEVEAMGLSRDIPGSVRWFVEPIVRNVSRQSLKTSLQQTERGVRSSRIEVAKVKFTSGS